VPLIGLGLASGSRCSAGWDGMSAAPAMTRPNAIRRAPIASGPEPMGSPKTRMPPMMADRFAATELVAIVTYVYRSTNTKAKRAAQKTSTTP